METGKGADRFLVVAKAAVAWQHRCCVCLVGSQGYEMSRYDTITIFIIIENCSEL